MRNQEKIIRPALRGISLAAALLILSPACGRSPETERDPELVSAHLGKARLFYHRGDYPAAAQMYHKALELDPDNADAYLQLAIIYDDNLKDKALAAAYYREFLRREPDSEKSGRVRRWLEEASAAAPPAPDTIPVRETVPERAAPDPVAVRPAATPPPPVPAPEVSEPGPVPSGTYTVRRGDTLAGIAREVYGDPGAWERIFEANRDRLDSPHALRVGQELKIPR